MFGDKGSVSRTNPAKKPPRAGADYPGVSGTGTAQKRSKLKVDYMDDGMPSDSDESGEAVNFDTSYAGGGQSFASPAQHLAQIDK